MPETAIAAIVGALSLAALPTPEGPYPEAAVDFQSVTPVLIVEAIEPSLSFWVEKLGFVVENQVADDDGVLGFVILRHGDIQIMYQTRASVAEDVAPLADIAVGGTSLFVTVDDLDAVEDALSGIDPVVPRRYTFYGADELIVREPGGHVVTFAQFGEADAG